MENMLNKNGITTTFVETDNLKNIENVKILLANKADVNHKNFL